MTHSLSARILLPPSLLQELSVSLIFFFPHRLLPFCLSDEAVKDAVEDRGFITVTFLALIFSFLTYSLLPLLPLFSPFGV